MSTVVVLLKKEGMRMDKLICKIKYKWNLFCLRMMLLFSSEKELIFVSQSVQYYMKKKQEEAELERNNRIWDAIWHGNGDRVI